MPAKVTKSAHRAPKPAPKPKLAPVPHKPTFPVREPAKTNLEPINRDRVKAVYTKQGWLMWGIMILCMVMGVFFWEQIRGAYNWVRLEAHEREYAALGQDVCLMPILTVPERQCENCFSTDQDLLIQRYEAQARGFNEWRAERCIPLM